MNNGNNIKLPLDYVLRDIVICALRYALPRHTYILDEVCEWIESHPEILDERSLAVMKCDVVKQLEYYKQEGINGTSIIDYNRLKAFNNWLHQVEFTLRNDNSML